MICFRNSLKFSNFAGTIEKNTGREWAIKTLHRQGPWSDHGALLGSSWNQEIIFVASFYFINRNTKYPEGIRIFGINGAKNLVNLSAFIDDSHHSEAIDEKFPNLLCLVWKKSKPKYFWTLSLSIVSWLEEDINQMFFPLWLAPHLTTTIFRKDFISH